MYTYSGVRYGEFENMDARLKKWLRWLEIIKIDIQELVVARHTFHEIQKMISENPALQTPNSFYAYFTNSYVSHVVIGVRRQIKSDPQSISLARLLEELTATPQVLTRAYYVGLYANSAVADLADSDFNRFAHPNEAYVDSSLVTADLKSLREATARCEDFADKRVAHHDKREPKHPLTYGEVDSCIELLDRLYVRYLLLFHASSMETLLPVWQYDWKSIFRTAWLQTEEP